MNHSPLRPLLTTILLAMTVIAVAGCGDDVVLFNSRWNSSAIAIDGRDNDWGERLASFEKQGLAAGIANDSDNLYICLKFLDRPHQMQVMRQGFTLWLDSTGSTNKEWGIRYPIGLREMFRGEGREGGQGMGMTEGAPADSDRMGMARDNFRQMLHEVEIVGPDGNVTDRFNNFGGAGFDVSMNDSSGSLVYELRIPLSTSNAKYTLGSRPGGVVGIGLETEQFSRGNGGSPRAGGGAPGGGAPGGGGGRRGGFGGRRGGGQGAPGGGGAAQFTPADPINIWAKVTLSAGK